MGLIIKEVNKLMMEIFEQSLRNSMTPKMVYIILVKFAYLHRSKDFRFGEVLVSLAFIFML